MPAKVRPQLGVLGGNAYRASIGMALAQHPATQCHERRRAESVRDYLRRVRSLTRGKTAFLVMPPIPGQGARYIMMDDYADIIRALPKQEDITVFDLAREFKAMPEKVFSGYFSDMAHPNNAGHAFIAEKIAAFLSAEQ